jgi:hypothetical protein
MRALKCIPQITPNSILISFMVAVLPKLALGCACGCGVFDIGTSALLPSDRGGAAYLEYDFMDQNQNHNGVSSAPAAQNPDFEIRTQLVTAGAQYMFTREYGAQIDVPYVHRFFQTTDDSGAVVDFNHGALGDVRLRGLYTGLSEDMSRGFSFGLKLPTGDWKYGGFDRDTEIGTGSTDLLLGYFRRDRFSEDSPWQWFGRVNFQIAVLKSDDYLPGNELNVAAGTAYDGFSTSTTQGLGLIAQVIETFRGTDGGAAGHAESSGYQRLLLSPGVEYRAGLYRLYADVEVPIYNFVNGNQLLASNLIKLQASYNF